MTLSKAILSAKQCDYDSKEHEIIQLLYEEINRLKQIIYFAYKDMEK